MDSDCKPTPLGLFLLVTVALLPYIFSMYVSLGSTFLFDGSLIRAISVSLLWSMLCREERLTGNHQQITAPHRVRHPRDLDYRKTQYSPSTPQSRPVPELHRYGDPRLQLTGSYAVELRYPVNYPERSWPVESRYQA